MGELFGLPAHPLLIHAPVVLVPMAALLSIAMAVRSKWAQRLRWPAVGAVGVSFVLLMLARQSGIELNNAFDGVVDVSKHQSLANTTTLLAFIWLLVVVAYAVVAGRRPNPTPIGADVAAGTPAAERALLVVGAVVALAATIWLVRTGHEGAYSHWKPVGDIYFE